MKFCSECGGSNQRIIPEGDERLRDVCTQCKTIHYQNPRIIAGVIPVYRDKVLLCRRAIEPRAGYWTLPAGFLENGETTEAGALRECWEEARAKPAVGELFGLFNIPHIHQVYLFYLATLDKPEFGIGPESTEVELFSEDDVPWTQMAFPVVEWALHHFFEDRENGVRQLHHLEITTPWRWLRS